MKAASGLAAAKTASPALVEEAIKRALDALSISRADQVILFLSNEFGADVASAIRIAVATAGTLRVSGMRTPGVFTEQGWEIDRPAAAAMVISCTNEAAPTEMDTPLLSFSSLGYLPHSWENGAPRAGLLSPGGLSWQAGRIAENAEDRIASRSPPRQIHSRGFKRLSKYLVVTAASGRTLSMLAGQPVCDILRRVLPPEEKSLCNLHKLRIFKNTSDRGISILSRLAESDLLLSEPIEQGSLIFFAARHPLASAQEIREQMRSAAENSAQNAFAFMFSCVGRGPIFYGDDDADLLAFKEHFPELPLLGAYGSYQITRGNQENILSQNSVLTLLYEKTLHV